MDIKVTDLFTKNIPPFVKKFAKFTGKGINRYNMISENDKILLGISGGKDSLALALALSLRRRWLPINYELKAIMIEWKEYPIKEEKSREALIQYFKDLNIDFKIVKAVLILKAIKVVLTVIFVQETEKEYYLI